MSDSRNFIQILIDTLQKQVEVLKEILEITQEQSVIAQDSEFDEIMLEKSLNKKEVLIARLNELDDGFTSVYGRVRNEVKDRQELYKDELRQMQELIKECTDLGVNIRVLEERNREKLTQCFASKHKQYGSKQTAASVASRYNQTMNNMKMLNSSFFNQKN